MCRLHLWGDGWTAICGVMLVSVGRWLETMWFVSVCWVVAGKPCVLLVSFGRWLDSHAFCYCLLGGGWKAMCFVTVCLVVAGKPCVLLLSAWWWLESHVFCYCLLGGGWKAMCFVSVLWAVAGQPCVLLVSAWWWLESHVFCYCLLGGGWKAMCFVTVCLVVAGKAMCFVTVCLVVAGKPCVLLLSAWWWLEKPCVLLLSAWWWLESHVFCYCLLGGGWKAMCFVTVCLVVAGKPCVLLLSAWWWLESHVFCYCLLGGGWKAMCFVTVCLVVAGKPCVLLLSAWWWLESHVFCYCLLGGGWKAMCFVTVCLVVAGKPCVLLLSVWRWLESQMVWRRKMFFLFGAFRVSKRQHPGNPVEPDTMPAPEQWRSQEASWQGRWWVEPRRSWLEWVGRQPACTRKESSWRSRGRWGGEAKGRCSWSREEESKRRQGEACWGGKAGHVFFLFGGGWKAMCLLLSGGGWIAMYIFDGWIAIISFNVFLFSVGGKREGALELGWGRMRIVRLEAWLLAERWNLFKECKSCQQFKYVNEQHQLKATGCRGCISQGCSGGKAGRKVNLLKAGRSI